MSTIIYFDIQLNHSESIESQICKPIFKDLVSYDDVTEKDDMTFFWKNIAFYMNKWINIQSV